MSSRAVMYEFAHNCFVLIKSHCIHKRVNNGSIYAHLEDSSSCIHWSVPRFIVSLTQVLRYTVCLCLVCQLYHIIIVFPFFHTTTHNHSFLFICHLNLLCHWQGIQIILAYDSRLIFCLLLLCPLLLAFVHNSVHSIYPNRLHLSLTELCISIYVLMPCHYVGLHPISYSIIYIHTYMCVGYLNSHQIPTLVSCSLLHIGLKSVFFPFP